MPGLIQRAPQGLLALLDAKTSGRNPNAFEDNVRGTVELRDYYELQSLASRDIAITGAAFTAALGTALVPVGGQNQPLQDEIWRLRGIGLRASTAPAAGTTCLFSLGVFDNRSNDFVMYGTSPRFAGAAQFPAFGVQCDIYIKPGFAVGVYVSEAAASTDFLLACQFALYKPV